MRVTRNGLAMELLAEPHALIAGSTGSGKSTALDTILYTLCSYPDKFYMIIDFKQISLLKWEYCRKCKSYARTADEARAVISYAVELMEERVKRLRRQRRDKSKEAHLYIVIDEAAEFLDKCPDLYEDLKSILRLGRAVNIHVLLATQSPNRNTIKADLVLNITGRLGLRCATFLESKQIINAPGCELLPRYGRALWLSPEHLHPVPVDIKLTPEEDIKALVKEINRINNPLNPLARFWRMLTE